LYKYLSLSAPIIQGVEDLEKAFSSELAAIASSQQKEANDELSKKK